MTRAKVFLFFALLTAAYAQVDPLIATRPADRIAPIDDSRRVPLVDAKPPISVLFDQGAVSPDFPMEHMTLVLRAGADQESALQTLSAMQQDAQSPLYRHWLTPETFGSHFGVSGRDMAAIAAWLRSYGFTVDPPPAGRRWLNFSGTAAQVEAAFHTAIHSYSVNGRTRHANSAVPDIPEALAAVVEGPASFNDFRAATGPAPKYLSNGSHLVAPYDFAAIYDSAALYNNGSTLEGGKGVNIAIVGRSNINQNDIAKLVNNTNNYGIATPQVVITPYGDPGIDCNQFNINYSTQGCGDWFEATADVTRAGTVAPQAQVILVPVASTNSADGVQLSAQYIVDRNLAQIVSMSFSDCEPAMTSSIQQLWYNMWAQAATQGMSVFIASGDYGADDCYPQREEGSTLFIGPSVNGLCSPTYVVCVGGTLFDDGSSPGNYWSNSGNALGYIPEDVWNETENLVSYASGGGASIYYTKPDWQIAVTPGDGARDVPDVSLSSSFHDAYVVYLGGSQTTAQGTSTSTPSFAGIMALLIGATGSNLPWGNPAPALYRLQQANQFASPFHPTIAGNNNAPEAQGFTAFGAPYNEATGLGSVDTGALAARTLGIALTHTGNFAQGQLGAVYTAAVSTTTLPSDNPVTVTDTLPAGLTMVSMQGAGWRCSTTNTSGACTSNSVLSANSTDSIGITVNVSGSAPSSLTNQVSVTATGSLGATAADRTAITPPAQSIAFGPLSNLMLGTPPFTVSAAASSGLTVGFGSLTGQVCTVSGTTVTLAAPGICIIQATQNGSANYAPAPPVNQSFVVYDLCDLTQAGSVSASDVQAIVNQAQGLAQPVDNWSGSGAITVVDIQIEIAAALGKSCFAQ